MSNLKFVMLANIIIRCTIIICVTIAAIHFNNTMLLLWYTLSLFVSYEYHSETERTKGNDT